MRAIMNESTLYSDMRGKPRIYLDVCCLNRPFDDLSQEKVRIEAEAVKSILRFIGTGKCIGIGGEAVEYEIGRTADPDRCLEVSALAAVLSERVRIEASDRARGRILESLGFAAMDSVHLACAEKAGVDVFLTVDDDLLKKAYRHAKTLRVPVANPLTWLKENLAI